MQQSRFMPYLGIVTYPRPDLSAAADRIAQFQELGVKRLVFEGRTRIGKLGIVGLGTVSMVVKGRGDGGPEFVVKIRRTDANRESMAEEFRLTRIANRVGVGAEAYGCTHDVMTMRFIKGQGVEDFVRGLSGRGTASRLRGQVHALLNQCRKLDLLGLDHGQLSDLRKHVIVSQEDGLPYIIDFESGSQARPTKNVTTAAQYLFIGSRLSTKVKRLLNMREPSATLEALKRYKRDQSDENYVRLLGTVGIRI